MSKLRRSADDKQLRRWFFSRKLQVYVHPSGMATVRLSGPVVFFGSARRFVEIVNPKEGGRRGSLA
jgi:hypothetical protein